MVQRSFGDRVEVFAVLVPLSPSLGRIQPLSGIELVIRCSQQVILVLLIYCREDRATLVPIHIGSLSEHLRLRIWHYDTFPKVLNVMPKWMVNREELTVLVKRRILATLVEPDELHTILA